VLKISIKLYTEGKKPLCTFVTMKNIIPVQILACLLLRYSKAHEGNFLSLFLSRSFLELVHVSSLCDVSYEFSPFSYKLPTNKDRS
jgi:hypothetical protein